MVTKIEFKFKNKKYIYEVVEENVLNEILNYLSSWDEEYTNPFIDDGYNYEINVHDENEVRTYIGNNAFANNYKEFSEYVFDKLSFNMKIPSRMIKLNEDYLQIKPIYDLVEIYQEGDIENNLEYIQEASSSTGLLIDDYQEVINKKISDGKITNYDIESNDELFAKAAYTYYYNKCFIDDNMEEYEDQAKILNCLYKIIELHFFKK